MVLSAVRGACCLAVRGDGDQLRALREGWFEGGFGVVVAVTVGGDVVDAAAGRLQCSGDFHPMSLVGSQGSMGTALSGR
jgi:hypothetical protein